METPFMYIVMQRTPFPISKYSANNIAYFWGCGYVAIPMDHPIIAELNNFKNKKFTLDTYLEMSGINQEITYNEIKIINNVSYLIIGFNTPHFYNKSRENMDYVLSETKKILDLIINYK